MREFLESVSAEQAEYARQELAAIAATAVALKGDGFSEKYEAYRRVKGILHVINLLSGEKPDWPSCEGCGKHILLKEEVFTYSDGDGGSIDFCQECNPDGENQTPDIAHDPAQADHDLAIAKAFIAEWDAMP